MFQMCRIFYQNTLLISFEPLSSDSNYCVFLISLKIFLKSLEEKKYFQIRMAISNLRKVDPGKDSLFLVLLAEEYLVGCVSYFLFAHSGLFEHGFSSLFHRIFIIVYLIVR